MHSDRPWLLVFDLDGTLIDSSLDLCLAVNAALSHVGVRELPHEMIAGYIGDGAAMLMRRALGGPGDLDSDPEEKSVSAAHFESAFAFFLSFYREHKLDNTRLYAGVLSSLERIRQACPRVLMAVLTNKPVGPAREICKALGLSPFLFGIYGGDSFATKKPDPAGLLFTLEKAQGLARDQCASASFDAQRAVMIGDSAVDVFTAKRAGTRSLGCLYGLAPDGLRQSQPDLLCDSPADWPELLKMQAPLQ